MRRKKDEDEPRRAETTRDERRDLNDFKNTELRTQNSEHRRDELNGPGW